MGGAPHERGARSGGVSDETPEALDRAILDAHSTGDRAVLSALYTRAAERAQAVHNVDAEAFFLTHAYVFALDIGAAQATDLHARLKALGREE